MLVPIGRGKLNVAAWIVPNGDHVPIYGPNEPEFLRVVLEFLKAPAP